MPFINRKLTVYESFLFALFIIIGTAAIVLTILIIDGPFWEYRLAFGMCMGVMIGSAWIFGVFFAWWKRRYGVKFFWEKNDNNSNKGWRRDFVRKFDVPRKKQKSLLPQRVFMQSVFFVSGIFRKVRLK